MHIIFNLHECTLEQYDSQTSPCDILIYPSGENVNAKENSSEYYSMPLQYGCKGEVFGNFSLILGDCPWLPWQPSLAQLLNHIQNVAVIYLHIYVCSNESVLHQN